VAHNEFDSIVWYFNLLGDMLPNNEDELINSIKIGMLNAVRKISKTTPKVVEWFSFFVFSCNLNSRSFI